jgi:SAM-dependent methyltransferase
MCTSNARYRPATNHTEGSAAAPVHPIGERAAQTVEPDHSPFEPDDLDSLESRSSNAAVILGDDAEREVLVRRPMTMSRQPADARPWRRYLDEFHDDNAGVTEDALTSSVDAAGYNPYAWVAEALWSDGLVVDVGCGSGPMAAHCPRWIGMDTSSGELRVADARGRASLVVASASELPIDDGVASAVVAVMSLMVVDDPLAALREASRVLCAHGRLVIVVPSAGPLTIADRIRYLLLLAALGQASIPFPHPDIGRRLPDLLGANELGFTMIADESRRFAFSLRTRGDADLFVRSLYLPNVSHRRLIAAHAVARSWGRGNLGIPLRRVVAERTVTSRSQSDDQLDLAKE